MTIGTRSKKTIKVGGKAYPEDYNWLCPVCGSWNRSYELECPDCLWEANTPKEYRL